MDAGTPQNTVVKSVKYRYADHVRSDILRAVPDDGKVIGSIGCGTGGTEGVLVKQGRQVHGVDISAEAINVARTRLSSARVVDSYELRPFEPETLDGLIVADVLEHMPLAKERLREFVHAVKPGGWVIISVPNMRYIDALWAFVVRGDWPEVTAGIFDDTHVQVMTHKRLERWCHEAGLSIMRWYGRANARGWRRDLWRRWFDRLTLGLFHHLFQYQIQVLCRRERDPDGDSD